MSQNVSPLEAARNAYQPKLPKVLSDGRFSIEIGETVLPATDAAQIQGLFPATFGKPLVRIVAGDGTGLSTDALTVGVVLSGGPAPGGHNCIVGLFDALKAANPASKLIGFLAGPKGILINKSIEITADHVARYRNTGGFDLIGSGRDKIESPEQFAQSLATLTGLGIQALVVIGGDDSNTNAALLAEHFAANGKPIQVIGLPKTIDGDMRNEFIDASFGFDTAAKTFAGLVGAICRDSQSARKYYHFIKLMGRSASHVTLEVALQTQPNYAIISEEVQARNLTLDDIINEIADVIVRRAEKGINYGVIVTPEGLVEFMQDFTDQLKTLGEVLHKHEAEVEAIRAEVDRPIFIESKLPPDCAAWYKGLPEGVRQVLLRRDSHGNLTVSQVETEKLLIDVVAERLEALKEAGKYKGTFNGQPHFFGYEGRCVQPSNFDADYCYTLGFAGVQLIRAGLTGYTVSATGLAGPAAAWNMGGVPVTSMLNLEIRKGKPKPVIKKALVELNGKPFQTFAARRADWVEQDAFLFPGGVQYFGPPEVADAITKTLELEHS